MLSKWRRKQGFTITACGPHTENHCFRAFTKRGVSPAVWLRWPVLFPDVGNRGTCCVTWGTCDEITEIQLLSHAAAPSGRLTTVLAFLSPHFAAILVSVLVSTCQDSPLVTRPVISEPSRCSVVGVDTSRRAAEPRIAASITCIEYFSRLQSVRAGSGTYPV
jgi:hypothetical protein